MTTEHEKRIAEIRARLENGPLAKWDSRERAEFEEKAPADIHYLLGRLARSQSKLDSVLKLLHRIWEPWGHKLRQSMDDTRPDWYSEAMTLMEPDSPETEDSA